MLVSGLPQKSSRRRGGTSSINVVRLKNFQRVGKSKFMGNEGKYAIGISLFFFCLCVLFGISFELLSQIKTYGDIL